jgi:hypothetical protein
MSAAGQRHGAHENEDNLQHPPILSSYKRRGNHPIRTGHVRRVAVPEVCRSRVSSYAWRIGFSGEVPMFRDGRSLVPWRLTLESAWRRATTTRRRRAREVKRLS